MKLEFTELPTEHQNFAKELRVLAVKYGIQDLEAKYRPDSDSIIDSNFIGTITVNYRGKDDRGRPDHTLNIVFEGSTYINVPEEQEEKN